MKVKLTASAWRRLRQIRSYYKKSGNSREGRKISHDILKKSKTLAEYPYLGQEEENFKKLGQGHRYLLVGKLYKIIYFIAKPFIYITDIFDTRQNPNKMKP